MVDHQSLMVDYRHTTVDHQLYFHVLMINHIVNFFAIFDPNLGDLMVNYFIKLNTIIHGHFSRKMFDGLSGIWTRDFSIANRTFVPSWTISPCFYIFCMSFIIIYILTMCLNLQLKHRHLMNFHFLSIVLSMFAWLTDVLLHNVQQRETLTLDFLKIHFPLI